MTDTNTVIKNMTEDRRKFLTDVLSSEVFSHTRAGTGCWRDMVWIYHFDPRSPSGVVLAGAGDKKEVEPLLREIQNTSPLSPTEPR